MHRCGIIGRADDEQVVSVRRRLRERGSDPYVLDLSEFPSSRVLSLLDGSPAATGPNGIDNVRTWYVRSSPLPLPFFPGRGDCTDTERRVAYAGGRERRSFAFGFLRALERDGARLANSPTTFGQHFLKLEQLHALRHARVPVPRTLATNDPQALIEFAREARAPIVYKPLAGGALCRRLTSADLTPKRLALLAGAPVLFQEEVSGTNIRVYVVDGKVVAGYEIVSDRLDYRGAESAVHPTAPSMQESKACLAAARACEMTFTGIDIRRREDGTFAVLECNPSPMFAAIERRTGTDLVTVALAEFLAP